MAGQVELEKPNVSGTDELELKGDWSESSKSEASGLNFKLLAGLALAGALLAGAASYFLFFRVPQQPAPPKLVEQGRPLISTARAKSIRDTRNHLRSRFRSSHNQYLVRERGAEDMVWLASQAELTLLAGLFNHYLEINAEFFEFFRILSNGYLDKEWEVKSLYDKDLLPKYMNAERRRLLLDRRIEYDPGLELFDELKYVAFYDSLTVISFQAFLEGNDPQQLSASIENANAAKYLIRDFWAYFQLHLDYYKVEFKPSSDIWNRYYAPSYPSEP